MELDYDRLELIINNNDYSKLIGEHESDFFDCKRNPYHLKTNTSKFELAKDVSSFTNAGRGYILIGIETKKSKKSFYDEIISINPFKQSVCNHEQYLDVISDWIYPKPKSIETNWLPMKEDETKGIFVIKIPNQSEIHKPFLIRRSILEKEKISEVLIGYSERKQDFNEPKTIVELHQVLRDGLFYSEKLNGRLQSIETVLAEMQKSSQNAWDEIYEIEKRIETTLLSSELKEERSVVLTCYPETPLKLKTLLSVKPGSLGTVLESPPTIRSSGFGLRGFDRSQYKGTFKRVSSGKRSTIDLYKDGVLIAALKADRDYLCWGMRDFVFNPVALIESIFCFVHLYKFVIEDSHKNPIKIRFRIDLRNFHLNGKINKLAYGDLENLKIIFGEEIMPAPDNNWTDELEIETEDYELSQVTYLLLEKIYDYFGIPNEEIPYTKEKNGLKFIDVDKIKTI